MTRGKVPPVIKRHGGGYYDGMEYSVEVQRNYSSKNAIVFEYLDSNAKVFLAKIKILF